MAKLFKITVTMLIHSVSQVRLSYESTMPTAFVVPTKPTTLVSFSTTTQSIEFTATSEKSTRSTTSTSKTPIVWPSGTYGLMEAAHGCPDDRYLTWVEGWRRQATEGALRFPGNTYSQGIEHYMKGTFARYSVTTYFCIKRRHVSTENDRDWPSGSYCILKYGACPKGFGSGSVFWDDPSLGNHNGQGGTLPEGTFYIDTEIFYCCRNDGSVNVSIELPTPRPFIMLRYTSTCQTVKDMTVHDIFI